MNWFYPVVSLAVLVGVYGGFRYWKKRQFEKALAEIRRERAQTQTQKTPVAPQGVMNPASTTVVPEPVLPDPSVNKGV